VLAPQLVLLLDCEQLLLVGKHADELLFVQVLVQLAGAIVVVEE